MKYFTPQLFVQLQGASDRPPTAMEDWELATERYARHIEEICPRLPVTIVGLLKSESLHDASLLAMWRTDTSLTLVLQPERPASLVVLTYSLIDAPVIDTSAFPMQYRTRDAAWLYDEIDIDGRATYDSSPEDAAESGKTNASPVMTHAILMSNGYEVRLRFHRLEVSRPTALFPSPTEAGTDTGGLFPKSA
jgi:hypothetical protein